MNFNSLKELKDEHSRLGTKIDDAMMLSLTIEDREINGRKENAALKRAILDFKRLATKLVNN